LVILSKFHPLGRKIVVPNVLIFASAAMTVHGRFGSLAKPSGSARFLRAADGRCRRIPDFWDLAASIEPIEI